MAFLSNNELKLHGSLVKMAGERRSNGATSVARDMWARARSAPADKRLVFRPKPPADCANGVDIFRETAPSIYGEFLPSLLRYIFANGTRS